jgi:hypothetical protein
MHGARLTRRLLSGISSGLSFGRPAAIDFLHDFFCPSDGIGNRRNRRWDSLASVVLGKLPGCEDRCHDGEDAFARFFHIARLPASLYIRHKERNWYLHDI